MQQKTVVIVGAGPAGSSTAHFLGRHSIKHVLFDKAVFPRAKVCGDGLAPKSAMMLDRINPAIKCNALLNRVWGGKIYAPNGHATEVYLRKPDQGLAPNAFVIPRIQLDQLLLDEVNPAFTETIQGADIQAITRKEQGFEISYTLLGQTHTMHADLVIGCDGDRSIVRKSLAPSRMDPDHYIAGIRLYYSGVKDLHRDQFFELYFLNDILPGYLWVFPMADGTANVGLGMVSSDVSRKKANLRNILNETLAQNPLLAERFRDAVPSGKPDGWGLPLGSKMGTLSGDGFLLTGDAASLIDPLTGEGVGNALYSGWLAADAIAAALKADRTDAAFLAQHYDVRVARCIGKDLKKLDYLSRIFSSPRLLNHLFRQLGRRPFLQDAINSLYDPALLRKKVRHPLFFPRLAWNLLF
jgi:menaquinone-9 beta-reductase